MNTEKYTRIWQLIQKASNEEKKKIIDNLTDEDLINLRYVANPYRKPLYEPKSKILACSYINMNEEYTKNFIMTSMVGFFYKMATEFKHSDSFSLDSEKGENSERMSEEEGKLGEEISEGLKTAYYEKFVRVYREVFEKSLTPLDHVRWMRAELVVFKKKFGSETQKINDQENDIKKYCKEHNVNYEAAFPNEIQLDENEIYEVKQIAKKKLGIKTTLQEHDAKIQDYILDFLDYYLKFDPNNHIRCGYYPHYDPVIKKAFESNPESFKVINTPNGNEMMVTDKFEKYLIPPLDTFYSFNNYMSANYEPLRQATNDIYFPAIFENALIARETFSNMEEADKWKKKFGSELDVAVNDIDFGKWIFIDSWAQNREKTTYDDEKGKLINEIIERKKQEEKMGKEILGKKKRKNKLQTAGKNIPFTNEAATLGAERLEKLASTQERKEEDLEVNVFSTKLLRRRRGVSTQTSNFSLNTPSSAN